jgi:hypothetical protein
MGIVCSCTRGALDTAGLGKFVTDRISSQSTAAKILNLKRGNKLNSGNLETSRRLQKTYLLLLDGKWH